MRPGGAEGHRDGRGAPGHGRSQPGACLAGGHQPDGPAAAAEGDRAGAGRLHGPHLAQLLQRVQRSPGEQRWERVLGPRGEGLLGLGSAGLLGSAPWWDFPPPCPALARGCSRHTRTPFSLLPSSSWWMPPTPLRSPRPACSCSLSSLQSRSPPCPSWSFSTRCEAEGLPKGGGAREQRLCFAALPRLETPERSPRGWLMRLSSLSPLQ